MQGRCQGFNCLGALNVILRERSDRTISTATNETLQSQRTLLRGDMKQADVLIVGAGPAGLAAALELKKLGVKDIVVAERESEAGGIPRMCGHIGFGLTDLHRVMTGPNYARKYREMAGSAEIKIRTDTTIIGWNNAAEDDGWSHLSYTSPEGIWNH